MPKKTFAFISCGALVVCAALAVAQKPLTLTIHADQPTTPVSPTLYGLMTEEINYSYEGGLYAEMVKNRTFRADWSGVLDWYLVEQGNSQAKMTADSTTGPSEALKSSLRIEIAQADAQNQAGVINTGWWGFALKPNTEYKGSFYAKTAAADIGPVTVSLVVTAGHAGALWLQQVSLFPPTYKNTPNGFRTDIMEKLAAMHPQFLRFPGGNYLEGDRIVDRFDWKKTVGPLVDRPGHPSPWNYWSTDGMGLLEFLEWCEDLNMQPVLAVYAGYSLGGQHVNPGADLDPYVQDAVDEIEYVTGGPGTKWGGERVKDGHPAPFKLTYVEIGNEDWFDRSGSYDGRFTQIYKAIKAKYPDLQLIATAPVKSVKPDVLDEHYYVRATQNFHSANHYDTPEGGSAAPAQWDNGHYDKADRNGPKIFVGEWATREGSPTPNMGAALGDAAWMTGLERNSDLIVMASYAPLFVNVNPGGMQWTTDLIGYDAGKSYGSPAYWAQVMFASHIGDHTLASQAEGAGPRFFYSITGSAAKKKMYLKLVNADSTPQEVDIDLAGAKIGAAANVWTLSGKSTQATNTIDHPDQLVPVESTVQVAGGKVKHMMPGYSVQVMEIDAR